MQMPESLALHFHRFVDGDVAEWFRIGPASERPRLAHASVLVAVDAGMRRRNSFGIPKLFRREPSTEGRTAATRRPARGRDGSVELVSEAEVGYPLTPLDEIRIKRPSLEPLACRLKAIEMRRSKRNRAYAGKPRRPKVERTSRKAAKWPQGAASICMAQLLSFGCEQ